MSVKFFFSKPRSGLSSSALFLSTLCGSDTRVKFDWEQKREDTAAMRTSVGINLSIDRELSLGYDLEKPVGKGQDGIAMNNN